MSNYPEGVTGLEYEIAGPDREYTGERLVHCINDNCPLFEREQEVEVELRSYQFSEWGEWTCEGCNHTDEYHGDVDDS